jgi:hypothetical protein
MPDAQSSVFSRETMLELGRSLQEGIHETARDQEQEQPLEQLSLPDEEAGGLSLSDEEAGELSFLEEESGGMCGESWVGVDEIAETYSVEASSASDSVTSHTSDGESSDMSIGSEEVFRSGEGWKITPPASPQINHEHRNTEGYPSAEADYYGPDPATPSEPTAELTNLTGSASAEMLSELSTSIRCNESYSSQMSAEPMAVVAAVAPVLSKQAATPSSTPAVEFSTTSTGTHRNVLHWYSTAATLAALASSSALLSQHNKGKKRFHSMQERSQVQKKRTAESWAERLRHVREERDEDRIQLEGYAHQFKTWHTKQEGALAKTEAELSTKDSVIEQLEHEIASLRESGQIFEDLCEKKDRSIEKTQRDLIRAHTQIHLLRLEAEASKQRKQKKAWTPLFPDPPGSFFFSTGADGFGYPPTGVWRPRL